MVIKGRGSKAERERKEIREKREEEQVKDVWGDGRG